MILSPDYKRFKHSTITGDTFTLLDVRSSIIHTMQGYSYHQNTAILWRLEKEAQNKENETQKTDRITSVYDRALLALPYADMIITGHTVRPDVSRPSVSTSHGLILDHLYHHTHIYLITSHGQAFKKPKTYLIIEMIPHHLVYYSYERKYHKLSSMSVPGYQCSNIYIDIEKGALMNKDIQ